MGMVTRLGKGLVNAGTSAVKFVQKNPKKALAVGIAGMGAVAGYEIGKKLNGSDEESTRSKIVKTAVISGLGIGLGIFIGNKFGKKIAQKISQVLNKPSVQKFTQKAGEKAKVVSDKAKEILQKAKKTVKNVDTKEIKKSAEEVSTKIKKAVKKGSLKAEKLSDDVVKVVQKKPEGIVKEKIDAIMRNYKNMIQRLNEDRFVFKGTSEEFSKRLQSHYKDLKARFPEYQDYLSKHLDDFMKKF